MKQSIALGLLILTLGMPFVWHARQQHELARKRHHQLADQVSQTGITSSSKHSRGRLRLPKPDRAAKEISGSQLATLFLTSIKETDALRNKTAIPFRITTKSHIDLLAHVALLKPSEAKILLRELLLNSKDFQGGAHEELSRIVMVIATEQAQAALELFNESTDILKDCSFGRKLIYPVVTKRVLEDLDAAIKWVTKNEKIFPTWLDLETKLRMVVEVDQTHPEIAFQLVFSLGIQHEQSILHRIYFSPKTRRN